MPIGVYDVPWRKTPIVIVGRILRVLGWNLGIVRGAAISGGRESWVSIGGCSVEADVSAEHIHF